MVSPVPRGPSGPAANIPGVSLRVASVLLVVGAALADAAGRHSLAYWALVAAVPVVAVAALSALGDFLDGTAATPRDRALAVLGGLALPFVLLAAAARAPLLDGAAPPAIGLTAVVAALAIFAAQALLTASTAVPRERLRAALRAK
jgi:hypothetical protein